jgi:hypothetical protein
VTTVPLRPSEALAADLETTRRTREGVEELIAHPERLGPDFTPIRRLEETGPGLAPVLGWKATGRGAAGSQAADALSLLAEAASVGLVERLDWAFRCHTFDVALDAGLDGELHLTPEPETFGSACPPRLAVSWLRGRRALSVCAELHSDAFADEAVLLTAVEEMQGWGWQVVYADVLGTEAEATALRLLPRVRPAYVQVDLAAPRSADGPLAPLVGAALDCGAHVMALGVDTGAALTRALELGATYGRGSLLGRPVPVPR